MKALWTLLLVLICAPAALATDRIYRDKDVSSPDGRYRVTAKSPDNAGPGWQSFQKGFDFAMTDTKTKRGLWRFNGGEEVIPERIMVSNSGIAMIYGTPRAVFVDPAGARHEIGLFPSGVDEKHVHDSTAGPMWQGLSRWSFVHGDRREYFVIRTWWGSRLVADLKTFEAVEPDRRLMELLDATDQHWVHETFADLRGSSPDRIYQLATAAHMAGQMGMTDTLPVLYKLEESIESGRSSSSAYNVDIRYFVLRTVAQLSIRRLGARPAGLPSATINLIKRDSYETAPYRYQGRPK